MSAEDALDSTDRQAELARIASIWRLIQKHLEHERRRIAAEITAYPSPIPACDAQFNFLLEQRDQITDELRQVRAALAAPDTGDAAAAGIARAVTTSRYLNGVQKRQLWRLLSDVSGTGA
jgi:hypothetical protein